MGTGKPDEGLIATRGTVTETRVLRLTLGKESPERTLSMIWQDLSASRLFEQYHIDAKKLEDQSAATRLTMSRLPPALAQESLLPAVLLDLAADGMELYDILVTGSRRKTGAVEAAQVFKIWFEETVLTAPLGTWRVEVMISDPETIYPLGFVFSPPAVWPPSEGARDFDTFAGFWACSLQLSSFSRLPLTGNVYDIEGADYKTISILVEKEGGKFREFKDSYQASKQSQAFTNPVEIGGYMDDRSEWHHMIYVALHSEESDILDHRTIPSNAEYSSLKYLVLDGDAVVARDRESPWPELILSDAWNGVIAIETDMPDFSRGFPGWRFLKATMSYKDATLADCLLEVRRQTWPEGLLFGVYCPPTDWIYYPPPDDDLMVLDEILQAFQNGLSRKGDRS